MCYVTIDKNITSLLILKIEYEDDDYSNFTIPFNKSKRLKIGTFIVVNNNVNEIYVTIFDKYKSLIKLLNNNGYYEYLGSKSDNKELVLVKRRND